ncbi:MAG TPA: hypothetical protein VL125_14950 [Pelobium sp.]|nr:hypothetical protein [Pelobium sp.]
MKNSMLITVASVGFALSACARVKVPAVVKSSFQKDYPGVKVKWEKEGTNYEAGFTQKGQETSVVYSPNGISTEKEVEIAVSELPKAVIDYLSQNFKGTENQRNSKNHQIKRSGAI